MNSHLIHRFRTLAIVALASATLGTAGCGNTNPPAGSSSPAGGTPPATTAPVNPGGPATSAPANPGTPGAPNAGTPGAPSPGQPGPATERSPRSMKVNIDVQRPDGTHAKSTVDIGTRGIKVQRPGGGTIRVDAGGVKVEGPSGTVNANPGGVNVDDKNGTVNVKTTP